MSTALRAAVCRKLGLSATATQAEIYQACLSRSKGGRIALSSLAKRSGRFALAKYEIWIGDYLVGEGNSENEAWADAKREAKEGRFDLDDAKLVRK